MRGLQLLLACSYFITFCHSNGISIVGPGYLHPNRIFTVVIANSYTKSDVTLRVSLTGGDNIVVANKQHITAVVNRNSVKAFKFKVGNIPYGEYSLNVQNAGGSISFSKTIDLQYISQTMSIFVQIDKPVYKPGDLLRFRIVIIDIDAMPVANLKSLDVDIKDEGENTIKQWTKPKLHNGVFESAMVIPGSPALGNWTIEVSADDGFIKQDKTKHFLVKEYVLPTFIVDVFPSELLLIENKKIALTIKSFYTFGDPVKGHVELKLFLSEESRNPDHSISKSITGTSQVEFNLQQQIDITSDDNKFEMVMVNVTVTEDFSNRAVSRSFHIPVYRYPFVVTSVAFDNSENSQIKQLEISVKDHDQQSVCCHQVQMEVKPQRTGRTKAITRESTLDTLGEASFAFETAESLHDLDFKVNIGPIKDVELNPVIHDGDAAADENDSQPSGEVITIEPKSISAPVINRDYSFVVRSAHRMTHLWYIVINQDSIVTQTFASIKSYKYNFKIKLTPAMAPRSNLIVFTTKNDVLYYSTYEIKFNTFRNSFNLTIDANEYLPNQDIALVTNAAKDSYVAYHAIDVSALHVGHESPFNGFGFTKQDVLDELDKYLQKNEAMNLIGVGNEHFASVHGSLICFANLREPEHQF